MHFEINSHCGCDSTLGEETGESHQPPPRHPRPVLKCSLSPRGFQPWHRHPGVINGLKIFPPTSKLQWHIRWWIYGGHLDTSAPRYCKPPRGNQCWQAAPSTPKHLSVRLQNCSQPSDPSSLLKWRKPKTAEALQGSSVNAQSPEHF